ncbi:MAG: YdcH family protein [Sphingomonas fennica]
MDSHHQALQAKHAGIDARIASENQRPAPDDTLIATLKKQKLRLKEEIAKS